MRLHRVLLAVCVGEALASSVTADELPGDYFRLMAAEIENIESAPDLPNSPGVMLVATVLYAKQHPANPRFGDNKMLELAQQLGDRVARSSDQDPAENRQDYEWEIHSWLDAYRLLEAQLDPERRERWRAALEKNLRWFAPQVRARSDFPRYQGPFIRTSTNHYAIWSSSVYLAGRVLRNKEWEKLGARTMHRLAAEEQTADGYWGEFTDNGPTTGYDYLTMACVALYWEHSRDTAALQALRRSTDFHKYFTWPDGTPVETINGRNRHWGVSAWGHFGFSHWPDGRGYAEFDDQVTTVPLSSRLRMTDEGDRLGLAHRRFFAVLKVAPPEPDRLSFHFELTEQGRGRMGEVQLNLQLVLKAGLLLETAQSKIVLGEDRVELGPDEIGGWIRHRGWTLHVDPTSRLTWPVFGFNPYRNAPETELRHAVGVLTVPVRVQPPAEGPLNWRRQNIAFTLVPL